MKSGRVRTLKSAKYLEKRKKKLIVRIYIYVSIFILIFLMIYGALRIPFFQIRTVVVQGAETLNQLQIENTAKGLLSGNYLYLVPRSNFLFYPKSTILETIGSSYKKIENIKAEVKGTSVLSIEIVEKKADVVVCEGFKEDEGQNTCYFADVNGYIYDFSDIESQLGSTTPYFKYYVNPNIPVSIGKNFIDTSTFHELQDLIKGIEVYGIKSTGLLISDDNSYELYIKNVDKSTAVVYFDNRSPFSKTFSDLTLFWQNVLDKKIGLKVTPSFEYINLRFANSVFYLINENGSIDTNKDGTTIKK